MSAEGSARKFGAPLCPGCENSVPSGSENDSGRTVRSGKAITKKTLARDSL